MLKPNPNQLSNSPTGLVMNKIKQDFGTYGQFKELMVEASKRRFGSGWLWWVMNRDGSTNILATPYQDNPYMPEYDCYPLLGIDVWEHAYYLKYDADRTKYVKNIMNIINWDEVESRCIFGNRSIFDVRIVLFIIATVLLFIGKADFSSWGEFIKWIFGIYAVGNGAEHIAKRKS